MPTDYTQLGTGRKLTAADIQAGNFQGTDAFIEGGTGKQVAKKDLTPYSNVQVGTDNEGKPIYQSGIGEISSPTPAPTGGTSPNLPGLSASSVHSQYFNGATGAVTNARAALDASYKTETERVNKELEESRTRIKELETKQEGILTENVQPLLQPFREELETKERERLYINENFESNQKLTRELETLLTEGNDIIAQQKATPGLSFVRNARVNQTIEDIAARRGVIEATMAARSGQIAEAQRLIDRSVSAITADRKDQLSYYSTLYDFFDKKVAREDSNVSKLNEERKSFLGERIALLQGDLKNAEDYANKIKDAMADPDTALLYANAGVKLTDSPEEINKKLADASYTKEVSTQSNDMAKQGYTYLMPGQKPPAGAQVVTTTDTKGKTKSYYKQAATSGSSAVTGIPGEYVKGANPVVDAWAQRIFDGTAKITDIPAADKNLRNAVTVALQASGNNLAGKPTVTELGQAALTTANGLLTKLTEGKGTSAVGKSGTFNSFGYGLIPGTERANFVSDFDSLKAQLSLEGVRYLKGQGAVSDAERALLSAAVTKLNLKQSESEFKTTLEDIIARLNGTAAPANANVVTAPDGTQIEIID